MNDAWNEACSSTGRFTFPTGNFVVQPSIFSGPCKANTVIVNVRKTDYFQLKNNRHIRVLELHYVICLYDHR